jgi:hypothetical protein
MQCAVQVACTALTWQYSTSKGAGQNGCVSGAEVFDDESMPDRQCQVLLQ